METLGRVPHVGSNMPDLFQISSNHPQSLPSLPSSSLLPRPRRPFPCFASVATLASPLSPTHCSATIGPKPLPTILVAPDTDVAPIRPSPPKIQVALYVFNEMSELFF